MQPIHGLDDKIAELHAWIERLERPLSGLCTPARAKRLEEARSKAHAALEQTELAQADMERAKDLGFSENNS